MMRFLIKFKKKLALAEVRADLEFIRKFRSDKIEFDEAAMRKELKEAKQKEDDETIDKISQSLAQHLSIKKEYQDLMQLESELVQYIQML